MARGQISIEYLILIGIALGLLIPGVLFFYSYTKGGAGGSANVRLNDIGLKLISTAKSTYALGTGAKQSIEFTMPEGVTAVMVAGNGTELVFVYDTGQGRSEAVFFMPSTIQMNASGPGGMLDGNISTNRIGLTKYRFTAQRNVVTINEIA